MGALGTRTSLPFGTAVACFRAPDIIRVAPIPLYNT